MTRYQPSTAVYDPFMREPRTTILSSLGHARDEGAGRRQSDSTRAKDRDVSAGPKLSHEASIPLKDWFRRHLDGPTGPYPNRATKERLAAEINCSPEQVGTWFLNARRRWKHHQKSLRIPTHVYMPET
jgi:hypothetical protein